MSYYLKGFKCMCGVCHRIFQSLAETKSKNTATRSQKRFKLNTGEDVEQQELSFLALRTQK